MGGRVASPTFVGRLEELELLEAARRRAADGEPAVVLVGGEAGVGKTRLVAELTNRCAAHGTRVLSGGCVPVGEGTLPYAPIVEALRTLVADLDASSIGELVGPSWSELGRLLPALGELDRAVPPEQAAQAGCSSYCLDCSGGWPSRRPWCWWLRICSGPISPPVTCSPSWSATCAGSGWLWWSPTATTSRAKNASAPTWPNSTAVARPNVWNCPG